MKQKVRAHIFIGGRVQGVFFRQNTLIQARSLGVKGWVRNLADGSVEAVFEGDEPAVNKVVAYCHYGPKNAEVQKVEVSYENYSGKFDDFKILNEI
jgi:acylphosphatase